jgi:hypothetical protein
LLPGLNGRWMDGGHSILSIIFLAPGRRRADIPE